MIDCPCCSTQLLRHIRHNQIVYFCRHCWQEMPALGQLDGEPSFQTPLATPQYSSSHHFLLSPPLVPAHQHTERVQNRDRLLVTPTSQP